MGAIFQNHRGELFRKITHGVKMIHILNLFLTDPGLFFRKLKAKITPLPKSVLQKKINGVIFEFDFSYDPYIKEIYFYIYEIETIRLMRKLLKEGDIFIDIGANIGFLSAIAMGLVGKTGQVHSFEPVPKHFYKLKRLATANSSYNFIVNQCAMGEREGKGMLDITNLSNIGWNTMVPDFMSSETKKETIEVTTRRMDNYLKENKLDKVRLIKIDTEGYEFNVLKGLNNYFENNAYRPAIICEIAPSACSLLGYTLEQLREYMRKFGYEAFAIENANTKINITHLKKTTNVIFIQEEAFS